MTTIIPQIAFRSAEGLATALGPPVNQLYTLFKTIPNVKLYQYTSDGKYLGWINHDSVTIVDAISYIPIREINIPNVVDINFSPKGKFIAIWTRYVKGQDIENPTPNMFIYEISTGILKISFSQKTQNNWKVQWTDDESVCARLVAGEVHFYDTRKFDLGIRSRLRLPQMTAFSMSPGRTPSVAAFIPEKNGIPASIRIFSLGNFETPILIKTFFKADNVEMLWNKLGVSLLIWTHTEVDASGASYYGETSLYYFSITGKFECRVPIEPGTPIHDVSWSPNSKEFIVIHGLMPSSATLYDWRAIPIFDFPKNHRNFVRYSPQSRIICIAGFGNLAGEMDFWDRLTCQKVGHAQASNSSFCDWCPDGRHVITATLTPRLRVDNGFKIWHYSGAKLFETEVKELYQISWRPIQAEFFPAHNTLSPPPVGIEEDKSKVSEKKPVGVYRPPGARASASNLSLRESSLSNLSMTSNENSSTESKEDNNLLHPSSILNNMANKKNNIKKQLSKRQMNSNNSQSQSPILSSSTVTTNSINNQNINNYKNKGQIKNQQQQQQQQPQQSQKPNFSYQNQQNQKPNSSSYNTQLAQKQNQNQNQNQNSKQSQNQKQTPGPNSQTPKQNPKQASSSNPQTPQNQKQNQNQSSSNPNSNSNPQTPQNQSPVTSPLQNSSPSQLQGKNKNRNKNNKVKGQNQVQTQNQAQTQNQNQAQAQAQAQNQAQNQNPRKQKKSKSTIDLQQIKTGNKQSNGNNSTGSNSNAGSPNQNQSNNSKSLNYENQKRIKLLQKKLREIADIKMKHTAGQSLERTQIIKMEKENDIIKELETAMGKTLL